MTTNSYFSSNFTGTPEQDLHESLIIESIQIYGVDTKYLPRTLVNYDDLFGEDLASAFNSAITVEMYIKSVDGFGGDGNFLSKFGYEIRDEVQLTVAKSRFTATVTAADEDITRPREGDIIQLPTTVDQKNRLYEITYVNYEEIFYQLGKLHTYEITAKVLAKSGETFNTGDNTIDDVMGYDVQTRLLLTDGDLDFTVDETVTTSDSITGTVVSWDSTEKILNVRGLNGPITAGETVTGGTSSASYTIVSEIGIDILGDIEDNDFIKDAAEDILDFDESNPFNE